MNQKIFPETGSGYGVKFCCPTGMSFTEDNFGSKPASTDSGFFQGLLSHDPIYTYIQVFWNTTDAYSDPVDYIDSFLQLVDRGLDDITDLGDFQYGLKDEHRLVHQRFDVYDRNGLSFKGIIGSWLDDEAERLYMVTYLTTESVDDEQLSKSFNELVESVENI